MRFLCNACICTYFAGVLSSHIADISLQIYTDFTALLYRCFLETAQIRNQSSIFATHQHTLLISMFDALKDVS